MIEHLDDEHTGTGTVYKKNFLFSLISYNLQCTHLHTHTHNTRSDLALKQERENKTKKTNKIETSFVCFKGSQLKTEGRVELNFLMPKRDSTSVWANYSRRKKKVRSF